jgi:hypothetical protein
MAYSPRQTLNYLDKINEVQNKLLDFLQAWDEFSDEWTRVDVGTGVTQDLLDGSVYAGITPSIVTTAVGAANSVKTGIDGLTDITAYRQQMEFFCFNRS